MDNTTKLKYLVSQGKYSEVLDLLLENAKRWDKEDTIFYLKLLFKINSINLDSYHLSNFIGYTETQDIQDKLTLVQSLKQLELETIKTSATALESQSNLTKL